MKKLLFILLFIFIPFASYTSTLDQSYSEANQDNYSSIRPETDVNYRGAQTFKAGVSGDLVQCKFYIQKVGSPTGNVFAVLYATSAGAPTGGALATSDNVTVSGIAAGPALVTFTFSTPYSVTTGTTYAISYEGDYTPSWDNYTKLGIDGSSPTYTDGNLYIYSGSWTSYTTSDVCFYTYVEVVSVGSQVIITELQ